VPTKFSFEIKLPSAFDSYLEEFGKYLT
jgi:hypothetical protein